MNSNFDHAGPLNEVVSLGNVTIRADKKLLWDGQIGQRRCSNDWNVRSFISRKAVLS